MSFLADIMNRNLKRKERFIMKREKIPAKESIEKVYEELKRKKYSIHTIKQYRNCYNGLLKYMNKIGETDYTAELGLNYIRQKFGIEIEGLYGKQPRETHTTMRALQVLWDCEEIGSIIANARYQTKPFECPANFSEEYADYLEECRIRRYTISGKKSHLSILQKFLVFIEDANISGSNEIASGDILKFITSYSGCSTRYIATIVSVLKSYLNFLLSKGYILHDLSRSLPKVKIIRDAILPSSWKKEDVQKLLNSIDRNNPEGKRDYAALLLVARLGLRAGDIRTLKLSSFNWIRKEISIVMQKTKQPLQLPILDDVGWAVIDYLKNGRPETASECVFIRHKAPYDSFGSHNLFSKMISRRMNKAGIKIQGKHGLHSLRSTLARIMLENNTPLPVISEALGHQNIQTTRIYLNIDVEGLKRCALDPEEVQP
jgi:site-specific recombinase XerC